MSMEKQEHTSNVIAGSKVLQCECAEEASSIRITSGAHTRGIPDFRGRRSPSPKVSSPSAAATVTPRTKVARETNIGGQNMPRVEVGMRGEFYYEEKWYRVQIVESSLSSAPSPSSSPSSKSEDEELYVVNYLNSKGHRGKDNTEDVSIEWLRGLVCAEMLPSKRATPKNKSTSHSPPRVYEGMLSKCRTERSEQQALSPYEAGYVTKVLSDDKVEFKFFDSSKYGVAIANVKDLLFLSAPPMAGSAVTEIQRAGHQTRIVIKSRNDADSEDDADFVGNCGADDNTNGTASEGEVGSTKYPAKKTFAKKSIRSSQTVEATTELRMPQKKRARQDRQNTTPIELDGAPICSICREDFSTDQSSFDDLRESKLPVSSMQCQHRVCCECLSRWQALEISKYRVVKKDRPKPKWMACPECKRSTAFNAVDMKIDTLLCGCLNKISRQEATIEKQKAEITRLKAAIESSPKISTKGEKTSV